MNYYYILQPICKPNTTFTVGLRWSSGLERHFSRSWRRSRVRIPVSPSSFLRECPEEKPREKSSRIVNERERDDVDNRSTGGKDDDGEGGRRIRNGYENWFRFVSKKDD